MSDTGNEYPDLWSAYFQKGFAVHFNINKSTIMLYEMSII